MHRLIHLLLLLMLTGCAATLRTDIAADDAGYVVYSTGADEYSLASYYTLHFRDAARRESVDRVFRPVGNPYEDPPLDFDTPSFQGAVFVLRMKPGEYEIYNYTVRKPHAIGGDTLFTAGREFRIPFAVEKGKITYLGQYRAQVLKGRDDRDKEAAQELATRLTTSPIRVTARAGEGGKLFGSVTTTDVAAAVKSAGGPLLDKKSIQLPGHIKTVGTHVVTVELHPDVVASVPVAVTAA